MELFSQLEGQYGLPAGILDSIWNAESGRGKAMLSPKGAQGHFQFMPATAKQYGVQDPADLTQSATGAARMLSDLLAQSGGDVNKALAGYNWGIGNVQRKGMEAAPAETRNYIAKVTGSMQPQDQSSDEWATLAQKFSPQAPRQDAAPDEWAQLASQFAQPSAPQKQTPSAGVPTAASPQTSTIDNIRQGTGNTAIDAGNAIATGYFRGLMHLAGLPVDTVANVLDLGKALVGSGYMAATGRPAPSALEIRPRAEITGSGQWIENQARKVAPGRMLVEPINKEYDGGYLQNIGGALSGIASPESKAQLVNQVVNNVASATLGKAVGDATGNQALAIAAGLSPNAIQSGAIAAAKYTIRGGEKGRAEMAQRIQDLKNAGVENPTMGLASGNQLIGGVENLLQNTPGAVNIMRNARDNAVSGLQLRADRAASNASPVRGSLEAGNSIQSGIQKFRDDFKASQTGLYNKLDQFIPAQTPVNVSNTKNTLAGLNADIRGAPELSKQFKNARIQAIEQAIISDTAGAPQTVMVYSRPPVGGGGIMNHPVEQPPILVNVPQYPSRNTLPFEAVKKTRTLVGDEIADTNIVSSVPRSKWNPLYGALSDDMMGAAQASGPQATQALNRANAFSNAGMDRLDRVQPFVNKDAPEKSFQLLNRTLGDTASTLQAVKKTLPEGARGVVAGTVIDRLGKASPGQQNEMGTAWSPETFLTNWNRMSPKARDELFSGFPNASSVKADVNAVAKATSMMRENSRMWANPSGTAANLAARGLLSTVAGGAVASATGLLNPVVPLMAAGGLLGFNRVAKGLTNQDYINSAASRSYIDPNMLDAQVRTLVGSGLLSNGKE